MRAKLFFLILLFFYLQSFGQKEKIKIFNDSKISIINFVVDKNPNKLPILTFTILNKTKKPIIFNRVAIYLIDFKKHPLSSSSNNELQSKLLTPIAGLDLDLPIEISNYLYNLRSPVLIGIGEKEASTINVRLFCNYRSKNLVPSQLGFFRFKLLFLTYDNKAIQSEEIELGNK